MDDKNLRMLVARAKEVKKLAVENMFRDDRFDKGMTEMISMRMRMST